MKHSVLVLTAVTLTLILRCHAQIDCNSGPTNKRNIRAYSDKCLANGFPTKIAGCVTIGSNTLSGVRAKTCRKLHQRLNACALNCLKAVDGGFSAFGEWSECSADCGEGQQTRERSCNNPAPANGGADCKGSLTEAQNCNSGSCSVDGGLSAFGEWSECSADCGEGQQTRERSCNNPAPANGGADCEGSLTEAQNCNSGPCPVDGGLSAFGEWSECSADCGEGQQTRERSCNNPAPANGGADCEGSLTEAQNCNSGPCPVDGGLSAFGEWSECSADCGEGQQTRERSCNNPAPANGGADCEGSLTEAQNCNSGPCPVDGGFSAFGEWSECSTYCEDQGQQTRERSCNNPAPANDGADCEGSLTEAQNCNSGPCPEVKNIASKGMAKQTDTMGSGYAELAIDGDNNGNYGNSVTHTEAAGSNAWWSLTYPRSMFIKEIQIFGRTDCCSERIDGASVLIDGKEVGTLNHNDGAPMVVPVKKVGSEIMIRNIEGGAQLSLAEVLVMGAKIKSDPCTTGYCDNIASEGLATQIDTDHNGEASRAIDGNTSNRWGSNSITHTKTEGTNAWWRLTFPDNVYMEQIKVYGREDCCADRLDNATVYVDGELVGTVNSKIGFPNLINIAVSGQVIEIRPADRQPLCLAEVEVIGSLMQ
ncbi:coadhesin-like [Bolinopsis microptera]|uniref:coadhesin-like n=1 Tax=Bolinopsis microptera TaxID=2820187 RepID=UPI003078D85C